MLLAAVFGARRFLAASGAARIESDWLPAHGMCKADVHVVRYLLRQVLRNEGFSRMAPYIYIYD
jgi:hypothetical protein